MLTKQVQPKDIDPILLDTIDLESDWVVEEESSDLSWLDEETEDLSSFVISNGDSKYTCLIVASPFRC